MEADVKALQRKDLSPPERLATQLRLEEKRIVAGTMDAVRRRLDPIRGIPTKSGALQDPNQVPARSFFAAEFSLPAKSRAVQTPTRRNPARSLLTSSLHLRSPL